MGAQVQGRCDAAVVHLLDGMRHITLALVGAMGQHEVAAGRERVAQSGHDAAGLLSVGDEMQDGYQQQPGRLAGVDQPPGDFVAEDLLWLTQVSIDDRGVVVAFQEDFAVRHDDRVDIGVDHPGPRVGVLGDLVHVPLSGNAGADIEELADADLAQEPYRPAEERPVGPADERGGGLDRGNRAGYVLVSQEVMGPAQPVVIDSGDVRPPGIHPWRNPARLLSHHASCLA